MTATTKSPLAPAAFPALPAIAGLRLATAHSGMRYKGRDDLMLAEFAPGTTVAGVFTRNAMPGAPVDWNRAILGRGSARALVVNAGIANVFTGKAGADACKGTARAAADLLGAVEEEVYLASTGVIGEALPLAPIAACLPAMKDRLGTDWDAAAKAILTTDTFPKGASATAEIDGKAVTIAGFAKGSGMIAPDMATMLAFLFTDAALPAGVMQDLLREANDKSFNCVTVDSDTSTSDMALLFATGQAGNAAVDSAADPRLEGFRAALASVMADLARQVARDGEGATKFITVTVTGAEDDASARTIARAIANSPLVKTAIAGEDANWGRIIMAVGKSGEKADRDRMRLHIGGILVAEKGGLHPGYDEAELVPHMKGQEIDITVDVGMGGTGAATVWTCDLTHGYIEINADYRS